MLLQQQTQPARAIERRKKPRMVGSYPAILQGRDAQGRKIRMNATLINISSSGFCLVLKPQARLDKDVFVLFRYSVTGPLGKSRAPLVALRGKPIRFGQTEAGMQTVAVKIGYSRFL